MPLFSRKPRARALTAAGVRVTPQTAATMPTVRKNADWQGKAWEFRDRVPELRFVGNFVSTQLSRVRWFIAEAGPEGQEPRPLTGKPPEEGEDPPEVSVQTQQIAIDALNRLDLNSRGSSMAGRGAENFEYTGACWLLGETNQVGIEEWTVRSVTEVRWGDDGRCPGCGEVHATVRLVEPGSTATGRNAGRPLLLCEVELYRLWNPHPECMDWADSKITACMTVLEEIVTYDLQAIAAAKSRIGAGSILYFPEELTLTRPGSAPVDVGVTGVDDDEDPVMAEFTAGMLTPISDPGDPGAVVPLILRGPAMGPEGQPMKDLIGAIQIPREDITDSIKKREAAVTKLAHGMDIPPEIITGLGDVNHWTGFVVSDAAVKNHLEPRAENFADSLTASYLRETCIAAGCPADEVARLCVWFDASELAQPADPMGIAKDLHDREVISDKALARAGGYSEDDMPSPAEKLERRLSKGRITPQAVPIIADLESDGSDDPALARAVATAQQQLAPATPASLPPSPRIIEAQANQAQATPERPVPDDPTPRTTQAPAPGSPRIAVTAAGHRRDHGGRFATPQGEAHYTVREGLCRELGQIDQNLVAELGGYIDAAILDMARQGANRMRSGAQRASASPEERAMFPSGSNALAVVVAAGRDFGWTITDQQALEGALDRIEARWTRAVATAAKRVVDLLTRIFGKRPERDIAGEYARRAQQVWPRLAEQIERTAVSALHGDLDHPDIPRADGRPHDPDRGDEPLLPRTVISGALTEVGGVPETSQGVRDDGTTVGSTPSTGLTAGETVKEAAKDAGAVPLAYSWRWFSHTRDPFHPHLELSGVKFAGFNDPKLAVKPGDEWIGNGFGFYHPGDHTGCGCSAELLLASPKDPDKVEPIAPLLDIEETPEQKRIRALAEEDDRRGTPGTLPGGQTHAQRQRSLLDELRRHQEHYTHDLETR